MRQEFYGIMDGEVSILRVFVLNGPNLNLLGTRKPEIYGTTTLADIEQQMRHRAEQLGIAMDFMQSNHEGSLIDAIHNAKGNYQYLIINAGAYTHYSYAIRDALASVDIPKVEIHISDITSREEFRKISVTAPVCNRQIYGQGLDGYLQAIDFLRENRQ